MPRIVSLPVWAISGSHFPIYPLHAREPQRYRGSMEGGKYPVPGVDNPRTFKSSTNGPAAMQRREYNRRSRWPDGSTARIVGGGRGVVNVSGPISMPPLSSRFLTIAVSIFSVSRSRFSFSFSPFFSFLSFISSSSPFSFIFFSFFLSSLHSSSLLCCAFRFFFPSFLFFPSFSLFSLSFFSSLSYFLYFSFHRPIPSFRQHAGTPFLRRSSKLFGECRFYL